MAHDEDDDVQLLAAAAQVHNASREVHKAVAELAVRPLDEAAAERMREVLSSEHAMAQASLQRLRVVTDEEPDRDDPQVGEEPA